MSRSRSGRHISAIAPGRSRRTCSVSRIASSSLLNVSAPRCPGFALSGKDQTTRYFGTPVSQRVDISTRSEASDKAMLTPLPTQSGHLATVCVPCRLVARNTNPAQ